MRSFRRSGKQVSGDDPAFKEAWMPKEDRGALHAAVSVSRLVYDPVHEVTAHRKRSRGSGKKKKPKKLTREQKDDESMNESPARPQSAVR